MSRPFDKPITIQKIDKSTEKWSDVFHLHARVNKAKADNQYLTAGATRVDKRKVFEIRYFKALEALDTSHQKYRILYQEVTYTLEDYDDFMDSHITVKLLGVSY